MTFNNNFPTKMQLSCPRCGWWRTFEHDAVDDPLEQCRVCGAALAQDMHTSPDMEREAEADE